jgi:hypothetical protein
MNNAVVRPGEEELCLHRLNNVLLYEGERCGSGRVKSQHRRIDAVSVVCPQGTILIILFAGVLLESLQARPPVQAHRLVAARPSWAGHQLLPPQSSCSRARLGVQQIHGEPRDKISIPSFKDWRLPAYTA